MENEKKLGKSVLFRRVVVYRLEPESDGERTALAIRMMLDRSGRCRIHLLFDGAGSARARTSDIANALSRAAQLWAFEHPAHKHAIVREAEAFRSALEL
jgi:hypothetical protein